VRGTTPRGAVRVAVRVNGKLVGVRHPTRRTFDLWVPIPTRDSVVRVTATAAHGRQSRRSVFHVLGLPRAARPRGTLGRLDPRLARRIVPIVRAFPGAAAVYVRDLTTGAGAAWNARAEFPAASTLKLAIAVETLRALSGRPAPGSYADTLLRRALIYSDNLAANELEVLYAGSTSGGSARVNALMRSLGLHDTEMYGGYERGTAATIPERVDEQPYYGVGKHTSAHDLAQLFGYVHLAAAGRGPLARRYGTAFTPGDARYLLYLLAHSADHGKLDRYAAKHGARVLHKAGWITSARHDAGLVYWHGGVFAVAVMTYGAGVGTASDVLAGRVALRALDRLRHAHRRG
jgi:beta-lactamase class A